MRSEHLIFCKAQLLRPGPKQHVTEQTALASLKRMAWMGLLTLSSLGLWAQEDSSSKNPSNSKAQTSRHAQTDARLELKILSDVSPKSTVVFKVPQNAMVKLEVTSDAKGELHLHAYRLKLLILAPGTQTLNFKAQASGKFNIEWHPQDKKASDTNSHISAHAHGPPLASLEVQPQ
ncbi:MAG: hypothetical protein ACKVPZ_00020 [Burkholderiaceae bacterium]